MYSGTAKRYALNPILSSFSIASRIDLSGLDSHTLLIPACSAKGLYRAITAIKFKVINWGNIERLDWKKLGHPRNWEKLGIKIGNIRVVRTTKSIIIHPGRLRGFDVDELLMLSGRIVERVRMVLENRFNLILSDTGSSLHQPITRFYSEEAKELIKLGTTIVENVGSIDNSPPERIPHEEYMGKDLAKARLLMPIKLSMLEQKLENIEKMLIKFKKVFNFKGSLDEKKIQY